MLIPASVPEECSYRPGLGIWAKDEQKGQTVQTRDRIHPSLEKRRVFNLTSCTQRRVERHGEMYTC